MQDATKSRLRFEVRGLINNSPKGRISAIHAVNDHLFVGTTAGVIALYLIKEEEKHISDHGVTHELKMQREMPVPPGAAAMGSDGSAMGSEVLCMQCDPGNGLLFVHYQHTEVGLCLLDMDTLQELSVNVTKARDPVSLFSLDQCYRNRQFVVAQGKALVLYSYAQRKDVRRVRVIANGYSNISALHVVDNHVISIVKSNNSYTLIRLKEAIDKGSGDANSLDTVINHDWDPFTGRKDLSNILYIENQSILVKSGLSSWTPVLADGSIVAHKSDKTSNSGKSDGNVEFVKASFSQDPMTVAISFPFVAGIVGQTIEIYNLFGRPLRHPSTESHVVDFTNPNMLTGCDKCFYVVSETLNDVYVVLPPPVEKQIQSLTEDLLLAQSQYLFSRTFNGDEREKRSKLTQMQESAGFNCLFRAKFKQAFENFSLARETCPKPRDRMDVREILQFFEGIDQYKLLADTMYTQFKRKKSSWTDKDDFSVVVPLDKLFSKALATNDTAISNTSHALGLGDEQYIQVLVHKGMSHLCLFLEKSRDPSVTGERDSSEQFVIEYALISLYLRRLKSDSRAYDRIAEICIGPNKCSEISSAWRNQLLGLLMAYDCYRHCALLIHSSSPKSSLKALNTLRKNIHKDVFNSKYDGVDDAIQMLCQMEGEDLMRAEVRDHIAWVISKTPFKAVDIFTSTENRAQTPDPRQVYMFLESYPLSIQRDYLHHLIYVEKNEDETYHTAYCIALVLIVLDMLPPLSIRLTLSEKEEGILGENRALLLKHLRQSTLYNRNDVLKKLKDTALHMELVELYRVMNDHAEALRVIVFLIKDHQLAVQYCDDVFKHRKQIPVPHTRRAHLLSMVGHGNDNFNPLFITYIEVSLNSDESGAQEMNAVQRLLNTRANDINPVSALSVLSNEMSGSKLRQFLLESIKIMQHRLHGSKINCRVSEAHNLAVQKRYSKAIGRNIIITPSTSCATCGRPIGNAVFAVFPDMSPVHYKCLTNQQQQQQDPSHATDSSSSPSLDGWRWRTGSSQSQKDRNIHPLTKRNFRKYPIDL